MPPSSRARRRCRRASCSGSPRSRAGAMEGGAASAANSYVAWARALDRPDTRRRGRCRDPSRSRRATRGRPRSRSPRSSTGCAIPTRSMRGISCGCAARCGRHAARRARPRHRHPRRDRRVHHAVPAALPDRSLARADRARREHFAALEDYPEARAFWWPRFRAHRALVRRLGDASAAPMSTALSAEIGAKLEIPLGERTFTLRTRADRIELCATAAMPSSTTRPARPPTAPQVRPGCRRSSRSKAPSCAPGVRGHSRGRVDLPNSSMSALRGGEPRRRATNRSSSRTARPTRKPTGRSRSSPAR